MIEALWAAFFAGLIAPLGAVCVLPLYPGFLSYLTSKIDGATRNTIRLLGLIVTGGIICSMLLIGFIFVFVLQTSIDSVVATVSPIAFGVLLIIGFLMMFGINLGKFFPKTNSPLTKNPYLTSFLFGVFFGAVVLPCNPGLLFVLFAFSTTITDVITNLLSFALFGLGMGTPLLILSFVSAEKSQGIIHFFSTYAVWIQRATGLIMVIVSAYYLMVVFNIFGL